MRVKRFLLHEKFFIDCFTEGQHNYLVRHGLPSGSKFIRWFQNDVGLIEILIEHESFDDLRDGEPIDRVGPFIVERM